MTYEKYKERGFSTPTGKVELYSTVLEKWGYDPLPEYRELPESPYSTPQLSEAYPYIILTDNSHESMDPAIGATNLRVCLCNIKPV